MTGQALSNSEALQVLRCKSIFAEFRFTDIVSAGLRRCSSKFLYFKLPMKNIFLSTIILCLFAGCERTRSFMQMDSNSGSPFLGLQLSVDAKQAGENNLAVEDDRSDPDTRPPNRSGLNLRTVSNHNSKADFVPTAGARAHVGSLKYSLPKADLSDSPEAAAEVEDILTRI